MRSDKFKVKLVLSIVFVLLLSGCNQSKKIDKDKLSNQYNEASKTLIKLPGGNIDYGIPISRERVKYNKAKKDFTKTLFVFLDEDLDEVIALTNSSLSKYNYTIKKEKHRKYKNLYSYKKADHVFYAAFGNIYREGFSKQVEILFFFDVKA